MNATAYAQTARPATDRADIATRLADRAAVEALRARLQGAVRAELIAVGATLRAPGSHAAHAAETLARLELRATLRELAERDSLPPGDAFADVE